MQIQWYPGHMHKASKQIRETLPKVDLIIEILDARIPFSSQNPMLSGLRGDKPCIKLLSKSDLADPDLTRQWQAWLEKEQGVKTLAVSTEQPEKIRQITELCRKMLPARTRGIKTIHAMIMGIPNVGKSTVINILAGRTIARTGNEPAVTKSQQRIVLDNGLVLSDTPGVLWPNIENSQVGYRLATTGAVKDTAIDYDDVAFFAADFLARHYPDNLKARYGLDVLPDNELALIEAIGRKRGCLRSGGQVELDKASKLLLRELRDGTLGRITLENPAQIEQEIIELEKTRAAKKAAREARKKKKNKGSR